MINNTVEVGKGMGGTIGKTVAPTAGHKKGAGRESTGWSALT